MTATFAKVRRSSRGSSSRSDRGFSRRMRAVTVIALVVTAAGCGSGDDAGDVAATTAGATSMAG